MGESLRREFLDETVCHLEDLRTELENNLSADLSEDFRRRFFRRLHTIKGTAQSFGSNDLARLAHEVENLLQAFGAGEIAQTAEITDLIKESLTHLLTYCHDGEHSAPNVFFEKINRLLPAANEDRSNEFLAACIPQSLLALLTAPEKTALRVALARGKTFYLLEAVFELANFSKRFIALRRVLNDAGEIVAVSPGDETGGRKIVFRLFYATRLASPQLLQHTQSFAVTIDYESGSTKKGYADLDGLLSNLVADGEKKARLLDKKVSFEISRQTETIARRNLILINHTLLHLLRNAIDHAIESPDERRAAGKSINGKITISIGEKNAQIVVRIADDGRGINAAEIIAHARRRGVIAEDDAPDESSTLDLIFTHGFSTRNRISEISGRGVGLDAVRDLVKKAGGEITVCTAVGQGTSFEIHLPR